MSKKNIKPKKARNWNAVAAWFRNSAGPMGSCKKEQQRRACRDWKEDYEEMSYNKKDFEVVAYQTKRFVVTVSACNEEHAKNIAEGLTEASDKWNEDYDYYNFSVSHAEEVTEDE